MLVSNKHFIPVIGLDIHFVILFGFPVPLPHPYIGLVIDPMDYVPFMGATTKVNHVPRGKSDTSGKLVFLFHIPMGGPFLMAPMIGHESVNFYGSKKVMVEGNLMSPSGHMLMTCNDIGMPLSLSPGKKFIPIPSLYLPTSYSIPLSFGKPVMVGGPFVPDWSGVLLNLIMSFGFGAAMKGLGKLGKKALTKFNKSLKNKIGSNKLSKALCKKGFEPVDLIQGIVIYDGVDFELPGPVPLKWERSWNSDSPFEGLLGHGNHLCYDMRIAELPAEDATAVLLGDGRTAVFELLPYPGNSNYHRHEQLLLTRTDTETYTLFDYEERRNYHFNKLHPADTQYRLISITSETDDIISFHYNGGGHLLRVTDSVGRHLLISSDEKGCISEVIARHHGEERLLVSYAYNENGDLTEITDALQQTTYIHYRNHLMTKKTDRNGISFHWEYDAQQRCIHTYGDGGIMEGFLEYHPREGFNRITNSQGHTTTYYYTPDFVVSKIKDPMGNDVCFTYTDAMELYRVTDPEGDSTGYTYDEKGNITSVVYPDGSERRSVYNENGQVILAADAAGNSRSFIYYKDPALQGLMHTITETDGSIRIFRYDENKRLKQIEDEKENATVFTYDDDHNLTAVQLPDGAVSQWQYDAWGHCTRLVNPIQEAQEFHYDTLGRLISVKQANGNEVRLQYNAYNNIIQINNQQQEVKYTYTAMGSLKQREEKGARLHFVYNRDEQLSSVVNEHGESYRFTRNAAGDIVSETGFDGITRHFERDSAGKVTKVHRPGGKWNEYEYNANGQLTRVTYSDGSWESYIRDRNGAVTEAANPFSSVKFERDKAGRVIREIQDEHEVQIIYTAAGKTVKSSLGADIHTRWNNRGNIDSISAGAWNTQIQRNLLGLEIERSLPGGVKSRWTYHPGSSAHGTPDAHEVTAGSKTCYHSRYHWNGSQQLKQIINGITGGTTKFGHDEFGNLAWALYEDGQYDYRLPDKAGNLYKTPTRKDREYTAGGRLVASDKARYHYDAAGNMTRKIITGNASVTSWEYEWFDNGLLKQVRRPDQKIVSFRYDALGRRTEKVFNGRLKRFLWNGSTPLHEWEYAEQERPRLIVDEYGAISRSHPEPVPPETLTTWVFEAGTFCLAARLDQSGYYSVINDHLGTPKLAIDEKGQPAWSATLDIYGNVRQLEGRKDFIPFRYQGQYEDIETGLYYNRYRYYSPEEGMYISQDPTRLFGGRRLYGYVSDTCTKVDVFGLEGTVGKDLIISGNATKPASPRPGKDIPVDEHGMVKSQADVEWPEGKSSFDTVENTSKVLSDTQVHKVPADSALPEGLAIKADGKDVGGPRAKGHHTIYPTRDMSFDEFSAKVGELESQHIGKIDKKGNFKPKCD
ncbi:hypothetical protein ECE50_014685 [Chitinophaga sp. Mgbs1]|uniref:Type IV secretion protein Rhs n=1 Tax=Chitinophaga solisilvae TaxID=1233460 RepID=A0A3S1D384_9BACT|nr:hypothetical protein [Chitinophaga solisilvae]